MLEGGTAVDALPVLCAAAAIWSIEIRTTRMMKKESLGFTAYLRTTTERIMHDASSQMNGPEMAVHYFD